VLNASDVLIVGSSEKIEFDTNRVGMEGRWLAAPDVPNPGTCTLFGIDDVGYCVATGTDGIPKFWLVTLLALILGAIEEGIKPLFCPTAENPGTAAPPETGIDTSSFGLY
jgi:hypothetical protein